MRKQVLKAGSVLAALYILSSCSAAYYPMYLQVQQAPKVEFAYGKWKDVTINILYFSGEADWETALLTADSGNWTEAIDQWITILDRTGSLRKRQAAEYNIACGCYLLRQWELADEWIKQCFKDCGKSDIPWYIKSLNRLNQIELEVIKNYGK